MASLDILIPTYRRPAALASLLTSLCAQTYTSFRVVVSDQTEDFDVACAGEVLAAQRVLQLHGNEVCIEKHLPRRGLAEQRQFLLDQARCRYALFLDDDLILEPWVVRLMVNTIERERCGFVGCAPIGLSYIDDRRPDEQAIDFWDGLVQPEDVRPNTPAWERYRLHNAANPLHVQQALDMRPERPRAYHVAWVGACVLYDTAALRGSGGFSFWDALPPEHSGEDVLAQLRVMARYGGCGVLPSGVYHQELPTTIIDRTVDAARQFLSQ